MKKLFLTFLLLTSLLLPSLGWGATYYVDNTCTVSGTGTSQTCDGADGPFITIAAMQAKAGGYAAGDFVYLKKAQTFREQLTVPSSGSSGSPITFGAYGSGVNPVIKRTELDNAWWEFSLFSGGGGFESFTAGTPDNFVTWSELVTAPGTVQADATTFHNGLYSIKCYRGATSGLGYFRLINQAAVDATVYYIEIWAKISAGSSAPKCYIKDGDNKYLVNDGVTWSDTEVQWANITATTLTKYSLTFTTRTMTTDTLSFYFGYTGTGAESTAWFDDAYWIQNNGKPTARIWATYTSAYQRHYGMIQGGVRIPKSPGVTTVAGALAIADGTMSTGTGGMGTLTFYRLDSAGDSGPGEVEIGSRLDGILISSKNYVTVDGIDVYGPAGDSGTTAETGHYPVSIAGTSDNVIVKNSNISLGGSVGIYSANTTTNIYYDTILSHDHMSTGIYMNSLGGSILNSKSYNNAKVSLDAGDMGGIGIQGGNLLISGNEVYNNGADDGDADFEISIVFNTSPSTANNIITKNYIHDAKQGGIQVAGGDGADTVISYNIINGFGSSSGAPSSAGKYAGIRAGGGTDASDNLQIYNNVVTGGSSAGGDTSIAAIMVPNLSGADATNLKVKNNIIYNNDCPAVFVGSTITTTTYEFSNNNYYRADLTGYWSFKGTAKDTLGAWQTAIADFVIDDTNSIDTDPKFISASDFHLQSGSPAINAGVNVSLTSDYEGKTVPHGIGELPDIGAYEFYPYGVIPGITTIPTGPGYNVIGE